MLKVLDLLSRIQAALRPDGRLYEQPNVVPLFNSLNKITRIYRTWPRFQLGKSREIVVEHVPKSGFEEYGILSIIEELLEAGALDNLTMCESCKKRRVFRVGAHGHFCSEKCRTAVYESQEARKKRKRQLAKKAYWDLMEKAGKTKRSRRRKR
jgi:hypothetical protein